MQFENLSQNFPDFDVATLPPIPTEWRDMAWRNDMCPCFAVEFHDPGTEGLYVWIDYADPDQREFPDGPRFCVTDCTWEEGFQSDDWDAVLKAVEGRRERKHDPFFEAAVPPKQPSYKRDWEAGMCRHYDFLLQRWGLPPMSADELWYELMAVNWPGGKSKFVSEAWVAKVGPDGVKRAAEDVHTFWMEWDRLEIESREKEGTKTNV